MSVRDTVVRIVRREAPVFSLDADEGDVISFATRQHGSVFEGRASPADVRAAKSAAEAVKREVPGASWAIETCDERVILTIALPGEWRRRFNGCGVATYHKNGMIRVAPEDLRVVLVGVGTPTVAVTLCLSCVADLHVLTRDAGDAP